MWFNSFVNAICDGNEVYDELYSNTTVYLDLDVVNAVEDLFRVESADQIFAFTNLFEFAFTLGCSQSDCRKKSCDGLSTNQIAGFGGVVKQDSVTRLQIRQKKQKVITKHDFLLTILQQKNGSNKFLVAPLPSRSEGVKRGRGYFPFQGILGW